jgi:hypothetical protein
MATDFLTLLERDHHDMACGLSELIEPSSVEQIRSALDGVRLGLTAHAEAQDIVLYQALSRVPVRSTVQAMADEARAAHHVQEGALSALLCTAPGTPTWRERARHLRRLVVEHAAWEVQHVIVQLRKLAPAVYDTLAGAFATERLRQLAMLQPSGSFDLAAAS